MNSQYSISQAAIGASPVPLLIAQDVIAFDGFGLQNANIITNEIDYDDTGNIDLNSFNYPRDDGGAVLSKFYRGRDIKLTVTIKAATSDAFQALLDTVKKSLSKTEGQLDVVVAGETRTIKATCKRIDFQRKHYNITFVQAQITFESKEPFWYSKSSQSFQFLGKTGTFSEEFTNLGSANGNPALYFIFGTSSVSAVTITAFGKTLTLSTSFSTGDILIVDSGKKSITKNGTEIDYTGQFPIFKPGSCPFTVTFTGTVAVDLTVIVPKNYL